MKGRKPLPTQTKIVKGTFRKDRANPLEPEFVKGIPRAPVELSDRAKVEWRRITKVLMDSGILDLAARGALTGYCQAFADFVTYTKTIEEDGHMVFTAQGSLKAHPLIAAKNQAAEKMHKFITELGISPASKPRVKGDKPKEPGGEFDLFTS